MQTGSDLYEYDFSRLESERLVDMTVDHDGSDPLGADVQGVIGASKTATTSTLLPVVLWALSRISERRTTSRKVPEAFGTSEGERKELEGHVPVGDGCNLFELHFN